MTLDREALAAWLFRRYSQTDGLVDWESLSDANREEWLEDADDLASWFGLWSE